MCDFVCGCGCVNEDWGVGVVVFGASGVCGDEIEFGFLGVCVFVGDECDNGRCCVRNVCGGLEICGDCVGDRIEGFGVVGVRVRRRGVRVLFVLVVC